MYPRTEKMEKHVIVTRIHSSFENHFVADNIKRNMHHGVKLQIKHNRYKIAGVSWE